jgi:hypothetical protein
VRLERLPPMAWRAALLGAKMVTLGRLLTVSSRLVAFSAPRSEFNPAAVSVLLMFSGRVRRLSMTWMTPPVKLTFFISLMKAWVLRKRNAYGLSNSGVILKSTEESDIAIAQLCPDALTASDLFIEVSDVLPG